MYVLQSSYTRYFLVEARANVVHSMGAQDRVLILLWHACKPMDLESLINFLIQELC